MQAALSIIIKPTSRCNLRCGYCYAEKSRNDTDLSVDTIYELFNKIKRSQFNKVAFLWHGGEPLICGIDFFKDIFKAQSAILDEIEIENSIQTNATLVDGKWIDFFSRHNISIGCSLDGPKEFHDVTRRFSDGSGAFDAAMAGAKKLQSLRGKDGSRLFGGAICVLTRNSAKKIDRVLDFFIEHSINVQFNPVFNQCEESCLKSSSTIPPEDYATAITRIIYRLFLGDLKNIELTINPVEYFSRNILSLRDPEPCIFCESCAPYFLCLDSTGYFYPCSKFCGLDDYILGNILNYEIDGLVDTNVANSIKVIVDDCAKCKWISICNSGCRYHSSNHDEGKATSKTIFCSAYKIIYSYLEDALKESLSDAGILWKIQPQEICVEKQCKVSI